MKVLIIGSDGLAHTFVWKLFNSPQATAIVCAPGNGGTSQLVPGINIDISHPETLVRWAFGEQIDLIIPTNNTLLHAGVVDEMLSMQIGVFGPPQRSARLAQSRCATTELLQHHALPVARGQAFYHLNKAEKYLATQPLPVVVRADHPALGSGIYRDRYTALSALRDLFAEHTLDGGNHGVVIEEFLEGIHLSFSALTDGHTALPLLPTRIYSRLNEDDYTTHAPGMGAHTGTSAYAQKLQTYLHQQLMLPIVAALKRENLPYWGILGLDCIITRQGPYITALRCNMRDMEAQVVLPRLEDDWLDLVQATIARRLDRVPPLRWKNEASVGIALVAQGYPNHFPVGSTIRGLDAIEPGVLIFHDRTYNPFGLTYQPDEHAQGALSKLLMGTLQPTTQLTTTGGHVLTVVALNQQIEIARRQALRNAEQISFTGRSFRHDIGRYDFS